MSGRQAASPDEDRPILNKKIKVTDSISDRMLKPPEKPSAPIPERRSALPTT